ITGCCEYCQGRPARVRANGRTTPPAGTAAVRGAGGAVVRPHDTSENRRLEHGDVRHGEHQVGDGLRPAVIRTLRWGGYRRRWGFGADAKRKVTVLDVRPRESSNAP